MNSFLSGVLTPFGVDCFGIAPFAGCLPLLPVRSRGRVPAGARSVIVCLFPYDIGQFEAPRNVAGYAVVGDYHRVAGEILAALVSALTAEYPGEAFVPFVDSSPIPEVAAAVAAGLGVSGLHGQLIHREYGTRLFIGEVVATLGPPPTECTAPDPGTCLRCGRCIAACPTEALGPQGLRKELCRSAITQKKGELSPWERGQVAAGGFAWGCDLCTGACPMNTGRRTPIHGFYANPVPVLTAENLDAAMADKPYAYRGRGVLERNLDIIAVRENNRNLPPGYFW